MEDRSINKEALREVLITILEILEEGKRLEGYEYRELLWKIKEEI